MGDQPNNLTTTGTSLPPSEAVVDTVVPHVYQAIVDAIPDMIIRISRDGIFQSFEGATAELYWPADAYIGKHLKDVLPPETAALFLEKIAQAFETRTVQYLEYNPHRSISGIQPSLRRRAAFLRVAHDPVQ
jgi:PAS domain-containing protein